MKRCELCKAKARMHCASDQASLCWDCDAAIHSANFLVARHSRNLLCEVCQSPTPWSASGCKLRPTVSVCEQCVDQERCDDSGEEESDAAPEENVLEYNQVVPWSPPPAESCYSADDSVDDRDVVVSRKRFRIQADQKRRTSSPPVYAAADARERLSRIKRAPRQEIGNMESDRVEVCGSVILDSLRRLHQDDLGPVQQIMELCDAPSPPPSL